jgi:hypothetical protein
MSRFHGGAAQGHGCSEPFFFQVVDVEPVMHDPVARDELLDVILHVLLEFQRQITQMQIALLIVYAIISGPWAFLGVFADPILDLVVCCAGGDARPELVVINLLKFQPSLIERAVGMVFALPAN